MPGISRPAPPFRWTDDGPVSGVRGGLFLYHGHSGGAGANILEIPDALAEQSMALPWCSLGVVTAAVFGLLAIKMVMAGQVQ